MPTSASANPLGSLGTLVANYNRAADSNPTNVTSVLDSTVTLDGAGSALVTLNGISANSGPYWNLTEKYDGRSHQRMCHVLYNPTAGNVYDNTFFMIHDGTNTRTTGIRMFPGWNIAPIAQFENDYGGGAYQHVGFTRSTSMHFTGMSSFLYGKWSSLSYNLVGTWARPTGRAVLIIGFDDLFKSMYDYAWPIIQKAKYAKLRFSLNAVGGYTEYGERTNFAADEGICSVANINTMYSSGKFKVANHTYNHYNLESGQPGTTAVNGPDPSVMVSREWMFGLSSGNTVLTLNGVNTANIASNANAYTIQGVLDTAWGVGVVEVGHSFGLLSANNGMRLVFTSDVTITATGGTNVYCRPAFTVEQIRSEYATNKAWIDSHGWKGGNCAVGPMGSFGKNVFAGLAAAGADTFRFMYENFSSLHRGLTMHQQMLLNPYTQGAQLYAGTGAGYALADAIRAIRHAQAFGGVANVYMHWFKSGASTASKVGDTEFETFLDFVMYEQNAGRLDVMTHDEYWDMLNGRQPSSP